MAKRTSKKPNGASRRKGQGPVRRAARNRAAGMALSQGVSGVTRRAFGADAARTLAMCRRALNAKLPMHLALPRPVGPYCVVRTTATIITSAACHIFSPMMLRDNNNDSSNNPQWIAACGVSCVNPAGPMGTSSTHQENTILHRMAGVDALTGAAEVLPCAMTVNVMNAGSLQTTSGMTYMARVNQQLGLGGDQRPWYLFEEQAISYYSPRLMSAAKLALRGVTCDAYPLDMTDYSSFTRLTPSASITGENKQTFNWGQNVQPAGLTPIVFFNQGEFASLTFLVTMEWRVRFDPGNPATAAHSFHGHTPDSVFSELIGDAASAGHGVKDIVETVAEYGGLAALAA